jgi:hypothetical protein
MFAVSAWRHDVERALYRAVYEQSELQGSYSVQDPSIDRHSICEKAFAFRLVRTALFHSVNA